MLFERGRSQTEGCVWQLGAKSVGSPVAQMRAAAAAPLASLFQPCSVEQGFYLAVLLATRPERRPRFLLYGGRSNLWQCCVTILCCFIFLSKILKSFGLDLRKKWNHVVSRLLREYQFDYCFYLYVLLLFIMGWIFLNLVWKLLFGFQSICSVMRLYEQCMRYNLNEHIFKYYGLSIVDTLF